MTLHAKFSPTLRILFIGLLISLSGLPPKIALAADQSGFTDEEKTRFTDALDRFPKKSLPVLRAYVTHGKVFWVDNRRIITTARELPSGWRAVDGEASKIVILDTDTGAIEEAPYRGDLECYSDERMIVRTHPDGQGSSAETGPPHHGEIILAGHLGEVLTPIEWPEAHDISTVGCQIVDWKGVDGFRIYRLLNGNGVLKVSLPSTGKNVNGLAYHIPYGQTALLENSDGKQIAKIPMGPDLSPPGLGFYYLPFRNQYFVQGAFPSVTGVPAGSLFAPNGEFQPLQAPLLLHRMAGSGAPWVMKGGILWHFRGRIGNWRRQGLYWQDGDKSYWKDGDKIFRVEDSDIGRAAVSPDGCKFYYSRGSGNPYDLPKPPERKKIENIVMNICQENK